MKLKLLINKKEKNFTLIDEETKITPQNDTLKYAMDSSNDTESRFYDSSSSKREVPVSTERSFDQETASVCHVKDGDIDSDDNTYMEELSLVTHHKNQGRDKNKNSITLSSSRAFSLIKRSAHISDLANILSNRMVVLKASMKSLTTSIFKTKEFVVKQVNQDGLTDMYIVTLENGADRASAFFTGKAISGDPKSSDDDLLYHIASIFDEMANFTLDAVNSLKRDESRVDLSSKVAFKKSHKNVRSVGRISESEEKIEVITTPEDRSVIIKYGERFHIVQKLDP